MALGANLLQKTVLVVVLVLVVAFGP